MVCSADDLAAWKDFPKGLKILLLDEDEESAAETRMKLEAIDYIVSTYCNEKAALEAVLRKNENYHVAIIEETSVSAHGSFKFLEMVRDIPTIVISNVHCLNTIMKCIALGAAEFLQKPLTEDKLRNIWQHVVHKTFNAEGNGISKSLNPINEAVPSMLQLKSDQDGLEDKVENKEFKNENDVLPAPSTPQLIKGGSFNEDEEKVFDEIPKWTLSESKSIDTTSKPECSGKKCAVEDEVFVEMLQWSPSESKSVDTTYKPEERAAAETPASADESKGEECDSGEQSKKNPFLHASSCFHVSRRNRGKMKVDWTPELHRRFVQAVEQLGIDQAIPSKILELMKVDGLTRHNVASHLQKFRMHRRHILPKDDERRLHIDPQHKGLMQKQVMAFPPYHFSYNIQASQVYPIWPHPAYQLPNVHMWRHAGLPTWHHWKTYPEMHADAWGCPVLPHYSYSQSYLPPQGVAVNDNSIDASGHRSRVMKNSSELCQAEKVIDEVMIEAMSKPWLPLPLGLKPPSTDIVLAELHRQGIHIIPLLPHHRS